MLNFEEQIDIRIPLCHFQSLFTIIILNVNLSMIVHELIDFLLMLVSDLLFAAGIIIHFRCS